MKIFNTRFLVIAISTCFLVPIFAQKNKNVLDIKESVKGSSVALPENYKSVTQELMEKWYLNNYTTGNLEETSTKDPGATESEIRKRLAALPTIIDMPYNEIVKTYIDGFTQKGRKNVSVLLGLSTYYLPIFEQALEANGLPLELKYLPIVESALDPMATSASGATGLWQFIPQTAQMYGMEISSLVDERRDPYISTEKACQYLKKLYEKYGDWSLAIAAYNCGETTLDKAFTRAGTKASNRDFWTIFPYLPEQTRGYVPLFIAVNYVMNYYPEHEIVPVLPSKPLVTDTIPVNNRVHFEQIAAVLDIPIDEIRILNPQFDEDIIPGSSVKAYNLILPSQQIHAYLISEKQIQNYEKEKYARLTEAKPGNYNVASTKIKNEPYNPSDPAPKEARAAEREYEITHPEPQQATTVRRRTTQAAQANQTVTTTTKTVTTEPKATASNNKNTAANETAPVTNKNVAGNTTKANKTVAKENNSNNKASKKSDLQPKQSAAANNKNKTNESQTANNKNNKQSNVKETAGKNAKDNKATDSKSKETANAKGKNAKDNKATDSKSKETANAKGKNAKDNKATDNKKNNKETAAKEKTVKQSKPTEYTVASGDMLDKIAKKSNTTVEAIMKANPKIKDPNKIKPGEQIKIPGQSGKTEKSNASTSKTSNTNKSNDKASSKSTAKPASNQTSKSKKK